MFTSKIRLKIVPKNPHFGAAAILFPPFTAVCLDWRSWSMASSAVG